MHGFLGHVMWCLGVDLGNAYGKTWALKFCTVSQTPRIKVFFFNLFLGLEYMHINRDS